MQCFLNTFLVTKKSPPKPRTRQQIEDSIMERFGFSSRDAFELKNMQCSAELKAEMEKPEKCCDYFNGLDPTIECFVSFGEDNASVMDVRLFLHELDMNYADLVALVQKYPKGMDTNIGNWQSRFQGYTLYSADKKLTITCASRSSLEGCFHYFGCTGEYSAVLHAYDVFRRLGDSNAGSWAGRNFI